MAISAKQDENGNYYVIDSGHNRLICFDENATVKYAISNVTDDESNGLYIDDFVIYNDLIYISASEWDGMILSKEVLLVYDKEKYVRTIATRDYSNQLVNKHRFHGLTVNYDALRYIEADKSSISVHKVDLEPIIASVTSFCTVIAAAGLGHMILNKDEIAKSNEKVERGDT